MTSEWHVAAVGLSGDTSGFAALLQNVWQSLWRRLLVKSLVQVGSDCWYLMRCVCSRSSDVVLSAAAPDLMTQYNRCRYTLGNVYRHFARAKTAINPKQDTSSELTMAEHWFRDALDYIMAPSS